MAILALIVGMFLQINDFVLVGLFLNDLTKPFDEQVSTEMGMFYFMGGLVSIAFGLVSTVIGL